MYNVRKEIRNFSHDINFAELCLGIGNSWAGKYVLSICSALPRLKFKLVTACNIARQYVNEILIRLHKQIIQIKIDIRYAST